MQKAEIENDKKKTSLPWQVRVKYMFIRFWLGVIVKVFGVDGLNRFGQFFGFCEWILQYKRRGKAYLRLKQIYGRRLPFWEERRIALKYFCRTRCDKMIYTIIDRIDEKKLLDRFHIEGKEYFDSAISRGKGTFFMFSHQGSHHLGGIFMALSGYRILGLRDPNASPLRRYIQMRFEKTFPEVSGLTIVSNKSFARTFFGAFKENRIVAASMDVWRSRGNVRTVKVRVFGQEKEFMSGMTHIALKSHAVILVGLVISEPGMRYCIKFHPWLTDPDKDEDTPETVQRVMQEYAKIIEEHLTNNPEQVSKTK